MGSNDQKVVFIYFYNAVFALCLLQAALLGITFAAITGRVHLGSANDILNLLTDVIRMAWVPLFLAWPIWLLALGVFWFFGGRKPWRLLVPLGFGIVYIMGIASFVVYIVWRIVYLPWRT
jgi:hypothetical protein